MIEKPFDAISESDLNDLLARKVEEGKSIEYKETLPGRADEDKREFLADVTSFANAGGGDLLYGVKEEEGIPKSIPGLEDADLDAEKLRLENMIHDGIEPRIPIIQIKKIERSGGAPVLLLRIGRSFVSPHGVKANKHYRFFTRGNAGKRPLDVVELRAAFAASETIGERMREFRADRVGKMVAGELPVQIRGEPKMMLHLLPLASFSNPRPSYSMPSESTARKLIPISGNDNRKFRYNLDGFVTHDNGPMTYCQFFRFGAIEAVSGYSGWIEKDQKYLNSDFEQALLSAAQQYLQWLSEIGISPPIIVTLSMVGVRGARMSPASYRYSSLQDSIDRDCLMLPDVSLESYDVCLPKAMRDIFDAVWNAAGFQCSLHYDENGNRRAQIRPCEEGKIQC